MLAPAYSPDLDPIEGAVAKRTAGRRRAAARTPDDPAAAIQATLPALTARDAQGWYRRAGHPPPTHDQLH